MNKYCYDPYPSPFIAWWVVYAYEAKARVNALVGGEVAQTIFFIQPHPFIPLVLLLPLPPPPPPPPPTKTGYVYIYNFIVEASKQVN